jgi:hypothetical protein
MTSFLSLLVRFGGRAARLSVADSSFRGGLSGFRRVPIGTKLLQTTKANKRLNSFGRSVSDSSFISQRGKPAGHNTK